MRLKTVLALLVGLAFAFPASASETAQKYGYKPESFEVKFYMQPRVSLQLDGADEVDTSFRVRRGRVYLTSTISPDIKGRIQMEVKPETVEALDVFFQWTLPTEGKKPLALTLGQFKKPFSYQELVLSSSNLNLIDRTESNSFLEKGVRASGRDQGAMLSLDLEEFDTPLLVHAGIFNGTGKGEREDDDAGKQFVARAEGVPTSGLSLGGNVALTRVAGPLSGGGDGSESYLVWGVDAAYEEGGWMLVGEVVGGDNYASAYADTPVLPGSPASFLGWTVEGIYRAPSGWEPAARFERVDPDSDASNDATTILTGQIAKTFSSNYRWQINVIHEDPEDATADPETWLVSQWTVRL